MNYITYKNYLIHQWTYIDSKGEKQILDNYFEVTDQEGNRVGDFIGDDRNNTNPLKNAIRKIDELDRAHHAHDPVLNGFDEWFDEWLGRLEHDAAQKNSGE